MLKHLFDRYRTQKFDLIKIQLYFKIFDGDALFNMAQKPLKMTNFKNSKKKIFLLLVSELVFFVISSQFATTDNI